MFKWPYSLARSCAGLTLLVVALTGCGGGGPALYPVSGSVLLGDQPAEGATVVFQPKATAPGALVPSGTVDAEGKFQLSTHPHGAGAPPGEYTVLVTWYPPDARGQENPKNRVAAKYSDPQQTPFRATVSAQSNQIEPFRVTEK